MNNLKRTLLIALVLGTSAQAVAQPYLPIDNPKTKTPKYPVAEPADVEPVTIPEEGCCERSEKTELALEREFWSIVQTYIVPSSDAQAQIAERTAKMSAWLEKAEAYATSSGTPYIGRILQLAQQGHLMNLDPANPQAAISEAFRLGYWIETGLFWNGVQVAPALEPNNIRSQHVTRSLEASTVFGSYPYYPSNLDPTLPAYPEEVQKQIGANILRGLTSLDQKYGPDADPTSDATAAFGLMGTRDEALIREGLAILEGNEYSEGVLALDDKRLNSGNVPFNRVGIYLAIAEAKTFLGDQEGAEAAITAALTWIDEVQGQNELAALVKAVVYEEQARIQVYAGFWPGTGELAGLLRVPSTSSSPNFCVSCHAGGEIPNRYYEYKEAY